MEAEIARTPINLLRESKLAREWAGDLGLISGAREGEVEVVGCVGIDELEGCRLCMVSVVVGVRKK